jgi:hypothetical protein
VIPRSTLSAHLTREWGMLEQPRWIQSSVRKVLSELSTVALMTLTADPRLEVMVLSPAHLERAKTFTWFVSGMLKSATARLRWLERHPGIVVGHSVWAYFPIHRRRYVARLFSPRPETRVLLTFGKPEAKKNLFEDQLRDHLGHSLLYLRSPKAANDCCNAAKEWRRSTAQRFKT